MKIKKIKPEGGGEATSDTLSRVKRNFSFNLISEQDEKAVRGLLGKTLASQVGALNPNESLVLSLLEEDKKKERGYAMFNGFVAKTKDNFVVGAVFFFAKDDFREENAQIGWLVVNSTFRNRGIGKLLVNEVEKHISGKGKKVVEVYAMEKTPAPKMFTSMEYVPGSITKIDSQRFTHMFKALA